MENIFLPPDNAQPLNPVLSAKHNPLNEQAEYIEIPKNKRLTTNAAIFDLENYNLILQQFLSDITALKKLVNHYVNDKFDKKINDFYATVKHSKDTLKDNPELIALFTLTRKQLHQIIKIIEGNGRNKNNENNQTHIIEDHIIITVLAKCAEEINLCIAGVCNRFDKAFSLLDATKKGTAGKVFLVRDSLLREFITFFLTQQNNKEVNFYAGNEIHIETALYNIHCNNIGLPLFEKDHYAKGLPFSDDLIADYLLNVDMLVNHYSVIRKLVDELYLQLKRILVAFAKESWLTGKNFNLEEIDEDLLAQLNGNFFEDNSVLITKNMDELSMYMLIDESDDGAYSMGRCYEKLCAWLAKKFSKKDPEVLEIITSNEGKTQYIASMDNNFFWVFEQPEDNPTLLKKKQNCIFDSKNHISLQLSHLKSFNFNALAGNPTTCYLLLEQALQQTDDVNEIASFFFHEDITKQLDQFPPAVLENLSTALDNKMNKNPLFQKNMRNFFYLHGSYFGPLRPEKLRWIMNTELLDPLIRNITQHHKEASIDYIMNLVRTFQPFHCRRLFEKSFKLKQPNLIPYLLLTGDCDNMIGKLSNDEKITLFMLLAEADTDQGIAYFIQTTNFNINQQNAEGDTPLMLAISNDNWECFCTLINMKNIELNIINNEGMTALQIAVSCNLLEYVKELLKKKPINVRYAKSKKKKNALQIASDGRWECLKLLVQHARDNQYSFYEELYNQLKTFIRNKDEYATDTLIGYISEDLKKKHFNRKKLIKIAKKNNLPRVVTKLEALK